MDEHKGAIHYGISKEAREEPIDNIIQRYDQAVVITIESNDTIIMKNMNTTLKDGEETHHIGIIELGSLVTKTQSIHECILRKCGMGSYMLRITFAILLFNFGFK